MGSEAKQTDIADRRDSSPWVSATASPTTVNLTVFEPSPELERQKVQTYLGRLETFKEKKWSAKLRKSPTTNPEKMAEIGWYCTGTDCAKCYACFKDLEGWEPQDNPKDEHDKHCPQCPLKTLNVSTTNFLTFRQKTRLEISVEFYRKKLICARGWDKNLELHKEEREELKKLIAKTKRERTAMLSGEESDL